MALGSTQPLTEMSTKCFPGGKGGRCVRLTTLPPSCAVVMKSGNLNFLEPSGPLQTCNETALPLPFTYFLAYLLLVYYIYSVSEKDCTLFLFLFFFLVAQCVESGVSCTDCY